MKTSVKFRLYPNEEQKVKLQKHFDAVRFVYNWGLENKVSDVQKRGLDKKRKIRSWVDLANELVTFKKSNVWLKEVNSQSLQATISNLDSAFDAFFKKRAKFPKFKKKKYYHGSFHCFQSVKINWDDGVITVPKVKKIKAILHRKINGIYGKSTVSMDSSGHYWISFVVENNIEMPAKVAIQETKTVGVDVGIKSYLTISDGRKINNPAFGKKERKRIKLLTQQLNKKKKESNNREKLRIKLARLHQKVLNKRNDFLHKTSRQLINDNQVDTYCVENLAIDQMVVKAKNKFADQILDASWSKFLEMLNYKADRVGKNIIEIGQFEPSSKSCPCGYVNKELKLSDRQWLCPKCNVSHDRDFLAAQNVKRFALEKIGMEQPDYTLPSNGEAVEL